MSHPRPVSQPSTSPSPGDTPDGPDLFITSRDILRGHRHRAEALATIMLAGSGAILAQSSGVSPVVGMVAAGVPAFLVVTLIGAARHG